MSIKPIDLQTNIGQMHEVGKNEHLRGDALAAQQHVLEKESSDKSRLVNTRLDETKKGEKTAIRDEGKKRERRMGQHGQGTENPEDRPKKEGLKDDRMGKIIDVLK
ncbi:MAG TPA: hypothetical protein P5295_10165 [Spirochaetota bacterium]|nr:hypothetical protein [Spirochaetota bacterium]